MQAFYSCREQGLLFIAAWGLLIVVAFLVVELRKEMHELMGVSSCDRSAPWLRHSGLAPCGMWDPQTRYLPAPLHGRQTLTHYATREVLLHAAHVF